MSEKQDKIEELELRVQELELKLSQTIELLKDIAGNLANHTRVIARLIDLSVTKLEEYDRK